MLRRRLRWVAAGLTLVASGAFMAWPQPDRITLENFDRIDKGMSRNEVEAILGPPGDFSSGPLQFDGNDYLLLSSVPPHTGPYSAGDFVPSCQSKILGERVEGIEWRNDKQILTVFFLPSGHVHTVTCRDVARFDQPPFENLLWQAKRQWRKWFPEN